MNPPPPMLPASGQVTARAKPTATAASTALPPLARTCSPTRLAGGETDPTPPFRPSPAATAARHSTATRAIRLIVHAPVGSGFPPVWWLILRRAPARSSEAAQRFY